MALLDAIKRYLFRRNMKQAAPVLKRTGEVKNYANARYVGIWFDGSNREQFALIDAYARKIVGKGKKVEILGYAGNVKKNEDVPFEYIRPREIGWTGVPVEDVVEEWCEKPFDLLLCLHPKECRPLEYMALQSKAKCRVGRYGEGVVECYDLMVMLEEPDLAKMIKQVDHLLTDINKKQD